MNTPDLSRREFLKTSGLLVAGSIGCACTGAAAAGTPRCRGVARAHQAAALARLDNAPTSLVRKDLASPAAANDLTALATAYTQMQAISMKDASDPHGWIYQANIHGLDPADDTGPDGVWNQCQHGSWWFFPWHRMYIYFFERIVRKVSGASDFALPYWYWDNPDGSQLVLNKAFLPGGALYIDQRSDDANAGNPIDDIDSILNNPRTGKKRAMNEKRFFVSANQPGFGGAVRQAPVHFNPLHGLLEGDGHDDIHVDVGGDAGWMSSPRTAAKDPLFWVHHANVDRIWIEWLNLGGGRANPGQSDSTGKSWYDPVFQFYDENKMKVKISAKEVLQTTDLGYVYDMYPGFKIELARSEGITAMAQAEEKPAKAVAASSERTPKLADKPLRIELKPSATAETLIDSAAKEDKGFVNLTIHGIKIDGNRASRIRVYLNLPAGAPIPGLSDPHYAGSITLFRHAHGDKGITATLPVTDAVRDLKKAGQWKKGELSVTLVQYRPGKKNQALPEIPFEKITLDVRQP